MKRMKRFTLWFTLLFVAVLAIPYTAAQQPCSDAAPPTSACAPGIPLAPGTFTATPFVDAVCTNGVCPDYGDPDHNTVSLYRSYGNTESFGAALTHFNQGKNDLAPQIRPLCQDGTENCSLTDRRIVFLILGFSNCDIEICGGNSDAWDRQDLNPNNPNGHLKGQPCATQCPNLGNPDNSPPWNQVINHGSDGVIQESFLYKVYPDPNPNHWLVGPHVVVFNGAYGGQTLDKWDPTPLGYYASHNDCDFDTATSAMEECNYVRVRSLLSRNGYSEKQVQAIFLKSSNSYPWCDLKRQHCPTSPPEAVPDAYRAEQYLGNILRYLKCCKLDLNGNPTTVPRYPNLKQVFLTSRIYGGYATDPVHGCLMPEPFAYESAFSVQRLIVAQIDRMDDGYSGNVRYPEDAPWVNWGPYLWANGVSISPNSGLNWCDSTTTTDLRCIGNPGDFRYGDLDPGYEAYWGDHTHPTADGARKVAGQLVRFIGKDPDPNKPGSPFVVPWIGQ